jgi:hypothetical protein
MLSNYTCDRWIWDYFIVSHAARMASNAGNDEIIFFLALASINAVVLFGMVLYGCSL